MADARIVHEGFWQQHGGSAAVYIPDFVVAIFSSSPINVSRLAIQGVVSFTGFSHGHWLFHQAQNHVNFTALIDGVCVLKRSLQVACVLACESLNIWSSFSVRLIEDSVLELCFWAWSPCDRDLAIGGNSESQADWESLILGATLFDSNQQLTSSSMLWCGEHTWGMGDTKFTWLTMDPLVVFYCLFGCKCRWLVLAMVPNSD